MERWLLVALAIVILSMLDLFIGGLAGLLALFLAGLYLLSKRKNNKIQEQNTELENLNNVKDQLFQIIGHDLRKPVIAFRNVSENLNYLIEEGDQTRLKKLGEEIESEGKALYNLTDNLLHWALTQKDLISIKPTKVNIKEVVDENIKLFRRIADKKELIISNSIDSNTYAKVDVNSLDVMVRNLIDNAIKFTPKGGEIKLKANFQNSMVQIVVADNGAGMSQEKLQDILSNDLTQSSDGTESEKGSGLGMTIVKSMAQKNNGKIDVKSAKGVGSTFTLSLPMAG